ncbi:exonuclease domain-containing protein [Streptomyces bauhiniae]|uniref:exonuclease domain-containing protein n=1 Tax=Streptomyces bauhiniae TaxID=2340725 RepID=UPI00365F89C8
MTDSVTAAADETPWPDGQMLALDVETTGIDPETARIVTAAIVNLGVSSDPPKTTWLVNPGIEIPAEASAIHRVTTEQARTQGRPTTEALSEIVADLTGALNAGWPLVVFRAPYALTVLAREAARNDVAFPPEVTPVIDPAVLDKQVDRYRRGRRTLPALCEHYRVRHDGPNDALQDALAAARLAWRLSRVHPQLAALTPNDLHTRQQEWAKEQAAGLQGHLRRTDPTATVNGDWPVLPAPDHTGQEPE